MVPADSDRASPTPPYSGYHYSITSYVYRTVTFYGSIFQKILLQCYVHVWSYNPTTPKRRGLGYSAFARHYLRNHYCFLFLRVLRCFSSPGSPPIRDSKSSTWRVTPFGNLRIEACMQLPAAYRSLPRPSSSPRAKASTMRPYSLPIL